MWGKSSRFNFVIAQSTLSHTSDKEAESETVYELVLRIVAFFRDLSREKILQRLRASWTIYPLCHGIIFTCFIFIFLYQKFIKSSFR